MWRSLQTALSWPEETQAHKVSLYCLRCWCRRCGYVGMAKTNWGAFEPWTFRKPRLRALRPVILKSAISYYVRR